MIGTLDGHRRLTPQRPVHQAEGPAGGGAFIVSAADGSGSGAALRHLGDEDRR